MFDHAWSYRLSEASCRKAGAEAEVLDGVFKPFVKHVDAQTALESIGLPLISLEGVQADGDCVDIRDEGGAPANEPSAGADIVMVHEDNDDAARADDLRHFDPQSQRQQDSQLADLSHSQQVVAVADQQQMGQLAPAIRANRNPGARQLAQLQVRDFQAMPHARCAVVAGKVVQALVKQQQRTKQLAVQVKSLKRKFVRLEQVASKRQKQLSRADAFTTLTLTTTGKSGKRLSEHSLFCLGVRRNLSNIACNTLGATLCMDLSGQRVARAEIKTAAALLSFMRGAASSVTQAANRVAQVAFEASEDSSSIPGTLAFLEAPWTLCCVAFRSDATNSSIWKREKLNVLDTDLAWVADFAAVRSYNADKAFGVHRCLPESQRSSKSRALAAFSGAIHCLRHCAIARPSRVS